MAASKRVRAVGSVLIIIVGLLNFHIPHFILESTTQFNSETYVLGLILLANFIGAALAALAICRNEHWGWLLGTAIVGLSFALYLAQETIGLPGLPRVWREPSRLLSLLVEVLFVIVAVRSLRDSRTE